MPDALVIYLPKLTMLGFVLAFGACVGSLVNVLVYRLPLGLDVVRPTSRCPKCDTKLTWRENIPVFGWILLRGRCRFCKEPISPEYPIVEAIVAALFGLFYTLWYVVPSDAVLFGIPFGAAAPEWAANGAGQTWPMLVTVFVLLGCLTAMTLIDARTYTIPLVLTWVPAVVALVLHTFHGVWFWVAKGQPLPVREGYWVFESGKGRWTSDPGWLWTIPTPSLHNWDFVGMVIAGAIGLALANLLLKLGVLTHSFADYDQWLEKHKAEAAARKDPATDGETDEGTETDPTQEWIQYPYARREMVRELAFLAPAALLAFLGATQTHRIIELIGGPYIHDQLTGTSIPPFEVPLWLAVLSGVLGGYLIGGAVVWGVRIGGSLAFNKEAMGLGDVHLMAAVGACCGWIDAPVAFLLAAFVALFIVLLGVIFRSGLVRAMPYGPSLAIATVLVLVFKPLVEKGLGAMFSMSGPFYIP